MFSFFRQLVNQKILDGSRTPVVTGGCESVAGWLGKTSKVSRYVLCPRIRGCKRRCKRLGLPDRVYRHVLFRYETVIPQFGSTARTGRELPFFALRPAHLGFDAETSSTRRPMV